MNLLKKLFKKVKPHSGLKIGDIYTAPLNKDAAENGFGEYSLPDNYFKVIDVNENGIMSIRYLGFRYENLRAGTSFDPDFTSHDYLIRKFKDGGYVRPNEKNTERFKQIVKDYNRLEQMEKEGKL